MEELEKYTKPSFQVNNKAIKLNGRDPLPPYYLLASIPPQQAPNYYPGFPQSMGYGVEESFSRQPARPVVVMVSPSEGNDPQPQYRSFLCFCIFNLLCCCWLLALYALQVSLQAQRCVDQNDPEGAAYHETEAYQRDLYILVFGIILQIALAAFYYFRYFHKYT